MYQPQNAARYPEAVYGLYQKFKNPQGRPFYQKTGKKFAIWCIPQSGDHYGVETTGYWWLGLRSEMGQVRLAERSLVFLLAQAPRVSIGPFAAEKETITSYRLDRKLLVICECN